MTYDAASGSYAVEFKVPSKLAPLQLGLTLFHPATGAYEGPRHGLHACVPVGMLAGDPTKLGATLVAVTPSGSGNPAETKCSVNFAVFSAHASAMSLCLVRAGGAPGASGGYMEIALDPAINKTGDVWHVCLKVRRVGVCWCTSCMRDSGNSKIDRACTISNANGVKAVTTNCGVRRCWWLASCC